MPNRIPTPGIPTPAVRKSSAAQPAATPKFKSLPKDERFTPENKAMKSQFKSLPKDERFTPENKAAAAKAKAK